MSGSNVIFSRDDHEGRRVGIVRRRFSYTAHIPERRGEHRRCGVDRRSHLARRRGSDRRDTIDAGVIFSERNNKSDPRSLEDRRAAFS